MLRLETDGPIANLLIDRPDRHNAFTEEMWAQMPGLLDMAAEQEAVRVLVLESTDARVFSAGADVTELRKGLEHPEGADRGLAVIQAAFSALIEFPKPAIAVIRGACHGGGVGIAVCCDIRLGDHTAGFSIPPARLGLLYPYPALRRLVWLLGPGQAKRLLFSARSFDAVEARAIGFLDQLYEPGELDEGVDRLVTEIAANGPSAVRAMKEIVNLTERAASEVELVAKRLERDAALGPEHSEGVRAFLEKRPPQF